jgi:hypothetical protein
MPRINQKTLRSLSNDDLDRLLQAAIGEGQDGRTSYCDKLWNERYRRINLARRRAQQATKAEVFNARPGSTVTVRCAETCQLLHAWKIRVRSIGNTRSFRSIENVNAPGTRWKFRASRRQKSGKLNSSADWHFLRIDWFDNEHVFFEVYDSKRKLDRSLPFGDLDWKDKLEVAS